MSGSYDRPPGRPPLPPRGLPDYDPYEDPVTGPHTGTHAETHGGTHGGTLGGPPPMPREPMTVPHTGEPRTMREALRHCAIEPPRRPVLEADPRENHFAPASDGRKVNEQTNAPIVPAGSVTGRSLTLVIAIMCFLACLTAGTVYLIRQSADAWLKDIASEVTVQIEPQEGTDIERAVKDAVAFLQRQPGIASVRPMSVETSTALLEPWLGKGSVLKSLPVPRLIALELDRSEPPDLKGVKTRLEEQFKGAHLDDHRRWQNQIRTVTRSFALGGLAILLLMAAATTAIIVSATKSSMASNREIVEVLHFVGATDRFIAREFEKHFLRLGIRAGLVGASCALIVFITMPLMMELLGGGSVTAAELNRLIGTGSLDMAGYALLGIVVVVIAALCMLTSRLGVYRILNNKA